MPDKNLNEIKQNIKEDQNKKNAADKAKPRCSTCGKYTDKQTSPQCFGHGGGGGSSGGSSGESASKDSGAAPSSTSGKITGTVVQAANVPTESSAVAGISLKTDLSQKSFNPEIISGLLSTGLWHFFERFML